ncbi:MAG: HisS family protein [Bacteroidetes bacterium]|nr:HisS family protein [Bacteroidota bacterium]
MAVNKPSVPSGMRDFSPDQVIRRNYLLGIIENVFLKYGFMPIQTPSMENIETLTGKYGDEGDQLIYKVLNSRIFEAKEEKKKSMREDFELALSMNFNSRNLVEKALRYDLTVPFARYVVMHRNEITFPFKRYQMQPVWRADRPQKGRFREFWQCDADVIGSDSLLNEVDLISIYAEVFKLLQVDVTIKINNRKILFGIAEYLGESGKLIDLTVAIDKLEKVGVDGVLKELDDKGFNASALEKIQKLLKNKITLEFLKTLLFDSPTGMQGIKELEEVFSNSYFLNPNCPLFFGGRYDDLTGIFGLSGVSGVGISFGLDRIYEVIEELKLFPTTKHSFTQVLFCCMESTSLNYAMKLAQKCREQAIKCEVYPIAAKLKKQLEYANAKNVGYAIIIGAEEMNSQLISLKNLVSGEQLKMSIQDALEILKNNA